MKLLRVLAATAAVPLLASVAPAQPAFTFRVADTATPFPGGAGNFTDFRPPSISGLTVAFPGFGTGTQAGVFTGGISGAVTPVATTATTIPGSSPAEPFESFDAAVINGGSVGFLGTNALGQRGVFAAPAGGGAVARVAAVGDPVPGGGGTTFQDVSGPAVSGGQVAFSGIDNSGSPTPARPGVFTGSTGGGGLTAVVAPGTPVAAFANRPFSSVGAPALDAGRVVFRGDGQGTETGIFTAPTTGGAAPARVADTTSRFVGGGATRPTSFSDPALSGGLVAFRSDLSNNTQGVFTVGVGGGNLTPIAITGDEAPVPGGGAFTDFGEVALSDGVVAFLGFTGPNSNGLFFQDLGSGSLTRVVATGDVVDGRTVASVDFSRFGLNNGSFAYQAFFTNGTSGVFLASPVPEPGLMLGLAAAGLGAARAARRRARG